VGGIFFRWRRRRSADVGDATREAQGPLGRHRRNLDDVQAGGQIALRHAGLLKGAATSLRKGP
jgi:hypothetical protein